MYYTTSGQPEHWILLAAFFAIFAVFGLLKKPRSPGQCLPCLFLGILAIAANSALLLLANRFGYGGFDILSLLTLRQAAIESSLIIVGYCLIFRGLGILLRAFLAPAAVKAGWRTYL